MEFKKRISCIHPTCRPKKAKKIREEWLERAKYPELIEYLTCFDTDQKSLFYKKITLDKTYIDFYHPTTIGLVIKTNFLATKVNSHCIIMSTDDTLPQKNWDQAVFDSSDWENEEVVLDVRDGSEQTEKRDYIIKGVILSKKRYKKLGFIFHPELEHLFADDFHSWLSYRDNVVVKRKDILFEHLHPLLKNKKQDWDQYYQRVNTKKKYEVGGRIFMKLVQDNINDSKIIDLLGEYMLSDKNRKKKLKFVLEATGFDVELINKMEKEGTI